MFNLGKVVKFEIIRALKKPSFWIGVLIIPVAYGAMFGLSYMSGKQLAEIEKNLENEELSFEIRDESKILPAELISSIGGAVSSSDESSLEKVKKGEIDAFYIVPENLAEDQVKIFAQHTDMAQNGKYSAVIGGLLKNSSIETIDPNKFAAINDQLNIEQTFFRNGEEYDFNKEMVVPAIFLAIFYFIATFMTPRMLTSITEEKENRVTEMILTSISAKTLIRGKIISIGILGVIQILALLTPIIAGYFILKSPMNLPDFMPMLEEINLDAWTIAKSALILFFGLVAIISLVIALGAAMPTAQEATNYFGFVVLFLMAPIFTLQLFLAPEKTILVDVLSYFPLTSPISLLLRNTIGTLSDHEAFIGIGLLAIFGVVSVSIAVRLFQRGALSYGKIVNLKSIFAKK